MYQLGLSPGNILEHFKKSANTSMLRGRSMD